MHAPPRCPVLLALALVALSQPSSPSRILAVFPTVSKSHFDVFQPLLLALAKRGHDVTVVNSFPQPSVVGNYTDISLRDFKRIFFNDITFTMFPHTPATFVDNHMFLISEIPETERAFTHPDVKGLLESDKHFDLVITELWNSDVFLGFGHKFKAPIIAMSSCTILPWGNARFGNPDNPAYVPNAFSPKMGALNFWQRVYNTYQLLSSKFLYRFVYNPRSERIAQKMFGDSLPPLEVLARNTSLLMVNTHHALHGPRPLSPQVVEIGGIHVKEPKPLDKELDSWLKESPAGVIYFSFGSMLRGATLPSDKVRAFLEAFRGYSIYRVLWKWEDDTMDNIPYNVKIMKWLPQRDVLAHPAVKLFISHGGLLGTTEAVVSGVPILGIPMYGDQPNNVAALVDKGVAIHIDYNNITASSIKWALGQLLTDTGYTENAKALSQRFQDRPMSPLDTAVFWTEYVIRHKGAPHLRSAAVDLTWYQYYLLDVTAFCIITVLAVLAAAYYAVKSFIRCIGFSQSVKVKAA
ncbi:UDP-glycosyltransferase UGT5-like isoform X1 [Macrosteles quadrilineatus]|uniref:UDP-glycosyltransferase UGT5-like isoform X1 n=1 Tax=Macrosteles quadrilineatus TaxID=74068 RepID=UPI0023E315FE|nr:UDP-glycosyltransferase UGT5-like isoform X1 [Macrosteles quadrilineatus]